MNTAYPVAAEFLKKANDLVSNKIHPTSIMSAYRLAMRESCKYTKEKLAVKVIDVVQAVKMTNQRGEMKYTIKSMNILKAHEKSARDSYLLNGYALNIGHAAQGMPIRVSPAKIACLDFNLQKTKMQLGVQVLVTDPQELEKIHRSRLKSLKCCNLCFDYMGSIRKARLELYLLFEDL